MALIHAEKAEEPKDTDTDLDLAVIKRIRAELRDLPPYRRHSVLKFILETENANPYAAAHAAQIYQASQMAQGSGLSGVGYLGKTKL